jgi:hypothetical protein
MTAKKVVNELGNNNKTIETQIENGKGKRKNREY